VGAKNENLKKTVMKDKKFQTRTACLTECAIKEDCSGIEWYAKGHWVSKCYLVLGGKTPAAKGGPGKRFKDAQCIVKG